MKKVIRGSMPIASRSHNCCAGKLFRKSSHLETHVVAENFATMITRAGTDASSAKNGARAATSIRSNVGLRRMAVECRRARPKNRRAIFGERSAARFGTPLTPAPL
jgi:hypothetical protein